MRFVPVKSVEQQTVLSLHPARAGFVKARTALANQIRGLLTEYGIVLAVGMHQVCVGVPQLLEDGERNLTPLFRQLLSRLPEHLRELDDQVAALDRDIEAWHRTNEDSQRVAQVPGIGVLTATALVASTSVPDGICLTGPCRLGVCGDAPTAAAHAGRSTCVDDLERDSIAG
jgi:transposase